jgi:hypothetical protein
MRSDLRAFTLRDVVLAAVPITLLVLLLLSRAPSSAEARTGRCISNIRQLTQALKLYEEDHGVLPVHANVSTASHWLTQVKPYLAGRGEVWVCPDDTSGGTTAGYAGFNVRCSYLYFYNILHLGPGGRYTPPTEHSPLVGCTWHAGLQVLLGRNDACIELVPPHRYQNIRIELQR